MKSYRVLGLAVLVLMVVSGCYHDRETPEQSAAKAFEQLESKLLAAKSVQIQFSITADGAFTASLEGTLSLQSGNKIELAAEGTFGGAPYKLSLRSDGVQMTGGYEGDSFELPTPATLNEAILIGATRMGLLHNLAQLTAAAPPDHADGGVQDWVQAAGFTSEPAKQIDDQSARGVTFQIVVGGEATSSATLWLDERSGMPLERTQVVKFGEQEMRVVEKYDSIKIE